MLFFSEVKIYGQSIKAVTLNVVLVDSIDADIPIKSNNLSAICYLTNNSDTSIYFWIKTKSWAFDNFLVSNKSFVFLGPSGWDINFAEKIIIDPHKSMCFIGYVHRLNNCNSNFSIGFKFFDTIFDLDNSIKGKLDSKYFMVWSNSIEFKKNNFVYELLK